MASIGIVKDKDRRAARQEEPFIGLARENIGNRFSSVESIPSRGVTIPTDSSPPIWGGPSTDKPVRNLQEETQEEGQEEQKRTRQRNQDENQEEERIRSRNQEETQEEGQDEAQDQDRLQRTIKKAQEEQDRGEDEGEEGSDDTDIDDLEPSPKPRKRS